MEMSRGDGEKLTEEHGYGVSVETLRKWMVAEGLWRSKKVLAQGQPPIPTDDEKSPQTTKKPLPYRRKDPLPPAQTPSLQTLPRPPLGSSASKAWPEVPLRP